MRIVIIDGQGGGCGKSLIEALRVQNISAEIVAVGTNAAATAAMLRAGADRGATGENAVIYNAAHSDILAGPMGIIIANSMLGEISPAMAMAISASGAHKVLIPTGSKCGVSIAGVTPTTMAQYIANAAQIIKDLEQ